MNGKSLFALSIPILLILTVVSCAKESEVPTSGNSSEIQTEMHDYVAATPHVGQLGRVLFYDKSLSENGTVSCGSCHIQEFAFADNKRFSLGFEGEETDRNTPPLQNLTSAFNPFSPQGQALFWDGRSRRLDDMVFQPFTHEVEMGLGSPSELRSRIQTKNYYRELFLAAFGSTEVTIGRISEALGGFVASMQSNQSPFELSFFSGELPEEVAQGFDLFVNTYQCMSCHDVISNIGYSEAFGDEFANIGLDLNPEDQGRAGITNLESDEGKFKIPNLRNIALTAPYMHDGRFNTLEEVLDHYSHGVAAHPNLDERLKDPMGRPLIQNITEEDKIKLIAFMNALTDESFITDPAFSDPFTE